MSLLTRLLGIEKEPTPKVSTRVQECLEQAAEAQKKATRRIEKARIEKFKVSAAVNAATEAVDITTRGLRIRND